MLELLQYPFVQRACAAGLILALLAPLLGIFLVVRRLSLLADCLAHAGLAGVAAALVTGLNPLFTALGVSSASALLIERLRMRQGRFAEGVLGLILWSGLALAVLLASMGPGRNLDLMSYLFGSITTVSAEELGWIFALALLAGGLLLLFFKELFLVSLDESLAQVSGVNPARYNYLLILLASLVVALFMRILGVLLIGAMMVVPVLTALNLKGGFKTTLAWAVGFALAAVFVGFGLSLHFDIAAGGGDRRFAANIPNGNIPP